MTQHRTPQGTPTGGQFAASTHQEAAGELLSDEDRLMRDEIRLAGLMSVFDDNGGRGADMAEEIDELGVRVGSARSHSSTKAALSLIDDNADIDNLREYDEQFPEEAYQKAVGGLRELRDYLSARSLQEPLPGTGKYGERLSFTPDAIREHFEGLSGQGVDVPIEGLSDDNLRQVASDALDSAVLNEAFDTSLREAITNLPGESRRYTPEVTEVAGVHVVTPATQGEARDQAIAWTHEMAETSLSIGELSEWGAYWEKQGARFDLTEEFQENGII